MASQLLSQGALRVKPFQAAQARAVGPIHRVIARASPCSDRAPTPAAAQEPSPQTASQVSDPSTFWFRAAADVALQPSTVAVAAMIGLALSADPASASDASGALEASTSASAMPLMDLSEEPLLANIARYARYFVTVMLGTGYVMLRPFQGLLKNPITAVLGVGGLVAFAFLIKYTVELMLGLEVYEYDPETFKIAAEY